MELQDRIRKIIGKNLKQLTNRKDGILAGKRSMCLIPFVGNGLSRIALARHPEHSDSSYYSLVDERCKELGFPKLEHLIARGFLIDDVFRLIIEKSGLKARNAIMKEIWKLYKDIIPDIEKGIPSPLHIALARSAKAFITTNYDLLIERTLQIDGIGKYNENYCVAVPMNKGNVTDVFKRWNPDSKYTWVYKIHGSFGVLPNHFPQDQSLIDGDFYRVQRKAGETDTIVASAEVYNWWAYECSNIDFNRKFRGPINILRNPNNLVLIIGHGMRAEERIIFRLLQTAMPSGENKFSAPILILTFEHQEEAISSRESHIISTINIPPGLAGSSLKRELAHLILLDELNEFGIIELDRKVKQYVRDSLQHFPSVPVEPKKTLAEMTPLVVSAGQMAYHTSRGLETAPSQERAYAPKKANWKPNDDEERVLEITSPMGDAFVPSYLWEGLGIPSALAGRVACDSAGRAILDYLSNETQYIDFSQIKQVTNPKAKTEQATVACWMDLRLIMDGERGFDYQVNINDVLPQKPGGRVIYASKPMLPAVIKSLDSDDQDC